MVNSDIEGNVYVNGTLLEEPYLKAACDCTLNCPIKYLMERFVIEITEPHRLTQEIPQLVVSQIVGKIMFRVW